MISFKMIALYCNEVFLLLYFIFVTCASVQINYVRVPQAVRNDSGRSIILDCDYSIRPDDQGLVVKWFLNGDSNTVYQWIPPQLPQALGKMKDRLDLTYKATADPKSVYRAMKIVNPTTDLAGEYKCFVSTFADEDFSLKSMIVFEPEDRLITYQEGIDKNTTNFTCFAANVYPEPKIILFKDTTHETGFESRGGLNAIEWNTVRHPNGKFTVSVTATAVLKYLKPGSLINCEMKIPGTGYVKRKSLLYYPPGMLRWNGSAKNKLNKSIQFINILMVTIIVVKQVYKKVF